MFNKVFRNNVNLANWIITFWIILLLLAIISLILLTMLSNKIAAERHAHLGKAELIQMACELNTYSNYLTIQTQKFVLTANVEYLQNYWDEVLTHKHREKILDKLKAMPGVTDKDMFLLTMAKRNSDELIQTELRAMKLVLSAYDVPENLYLEPIRQYQLMPTEKKLSPEDKLALAENIMFNKEYEKMKQKIINPTNTFIRNVLRTNVKINKQIQQETDRLFFMFTILIISIVISIIAIVWLRVLLTLKNPQQN